MKKKKKQVQIISKILIIFVLISCKNNQSVEELFLPNIDFKIQNVEQYEKLNIDVLMYQKKVKDTTTSYQFCNYIETVCYQNWSINFHNKDTLKIVSLLEEKRIKLLNGKWLTNVKFDMPIKLKQIDRNILYDCNFKRNGNNCIMTLSHSIVLYDNSINWNATYHSFYQINIDD
jgi:hypothetical protein